MGTIENAGAVSVIYGSRRGLTGTGDQFWTRNSPDVNGAAATNDFFGSALAAGDFNGDGFDDLAIGAYNATVGGETSAGSVSVLYGSQNGLAAAGDQIWTQNSASINDAAETDDRFGGSLASGDFNNDGHDDLALGVPGDMVGDIDGAGAVNVIYGSDAGLARSGAQRWQQNSAGIGNKAEAGDGFGFSLAAGDFNRDGNDDLAVGVPFEDDVAISATGATHVIYGASSNLTATGSLFLDASSLGFTNIQRARVGYALTAGDFDGDRFDDLAMGASDEDIGALNSAGAVYVAYGATLDGRTGEAPQRWDQNTGTVPDVAQAADFFGASLMSGDYDGDGQHELAIGVPGEKFGPLSGVGAVHVLYGFYSGLVDESSQFWHQALLDATDGNEDSDSFGDAFA